MFHFIVALYISISILSLREKTAHRFAYSGQQRQSRFKTRSSTYLYTCMRFRTIIRFLKVLGVQHNSDKQLSKANSCFFFID